MSDDDDARARHWAALEEGAEQMWRNAMAETVLVLLEEHGEVTRDSLRIALEERAYAEGTERLTRATYRGALNALAGRPPRG